VAVFNECICTDDIGGMKVGDDTMMLDEQLDVGAPTGAIEENYEEEEAVAALLNLARVRRQEWIERVGIGEFEEVAPQMAAALRDEVAGGVWRLAVAYFEDDEDELMASLVDVIS
jgi:hypothetical protein